MSLAGVKVDLTPSDGGVPFIGFYDADGNVIFTSRHQLFRTAGGDVLRGSLQVAARATPLTTPVTYPLGSCHALADCVMGYIKFDYGQSGYLVDPLQQVLPAGQWMYVSGSFSAPRVTRMTSLSFSASGGAVTMEEQLGIAEVKNSVGQSFPYQFGTMHYELWCGLF